ncbi:hypothetical protein [Novacetimonas maltaceti]|uniref:Uncharacterized protein n=1 Tax=Novacetimonas maltaceti TaxID=1203393 RepID=A0A2S3W4D4_9PROT|nr:hypothetical protein [Novacetimonas maltaceti]POF63729.1 hypothetical protein KMAL_06970 [Novacetimonas maltaceti]
MFRFALMAGMAGIMTGVLPLCPSGAWAGEIRICFDRRVAESDPAPNMPRFDSITVPSGTVFNYAGHAFGPADDPLDRAHAAPFGDGWRGLPPGEEQRRRALQMEDIGGDSGYHRPQAAVMISATTTLTRARPCANVAAQAVLSEDWTWTADHIPADPHVYYQAYGVVHGSRFDPTFDTDPDAFQWVAAHGGLNGIVISDIEQSVTLHSDD